MRLMNTLMTGAILLAQPTGELPPAGLAVPVIAVDGQVYSISNIWALAGADLQWFRDGEPIEDATGATYTQQPEDNGTLLSVTATRDGDTTTAAARFAEGDTTFYHTDFVSGTSVRLGGATVGTTGYDGWRFASGYTSDRLYVAAALGSGLWRTGAQSAGYFSHATGSDLYGVKYIYSRRLSDGSVVVGNSAYAMVRDVSLLYTDANNRVSAQVGPTTIQLTTRVGGVASTAYSVAATPKDGDEIEFRPVLSGGNLHYQIWLNGARLDAAKDPVGFNVSAVTRTALVAIQDTPPDDTATPLPFEIMRSFTVYTLPAATISVTSATLSAPTIDHPLIVDIVGSYTGEVSALELAWLGADGGAISGWIDVGEVTGGSFALDDLEVPAAIEGTTGARILVRAAGAPDIHGVFSLGAVAEYEPYSPFILGTNTPNGGVGDAGQIERNLALAITGQYEDSSYPPVSDEGWWPTIGSHTSFDLLLKEAGVPRIPGLYEFEVNQPATLSFRVPTGGFTPGAITSTTARFTISDDSARAQLRIAGVSPTPENPLRATCYLVSDTNRDRAVTDEHAALFNADLFGPGYFERYMKSLGTEQGYFHRDWTPRNPTSWGVPDSRRWCDPEFIARDMKQRGHRAWVTRPFGCPPAAWLDFCERLEAESVNQGVAAGPFYSEAHNEEWNPDYLEQTHWMRWEAIQRGLVVGQPPAETIMDAYISASARKIEGGTGALLDSFTAGQVFFAVTNWQNVIARCLQDCNPSTGVTVPATGSNAYFEVLVTHQPIWDAAKRLHGLLSIETSQIGQAVFGARHRAIYGTRTVYSAAQITGYLLQDEVWRYHDFYTVGHYAGTYVPYGSETWTTQHTTDQAAFVAGFLAKFNGVWPALVTSLEDIKHGVFDRLGKAGVPRAERPRFSTYEGGNNVGFSGVPVDQQAGVLAGYKAVERDPGLHDAMFNFYTAIRNRLGSVTASFVEYQSIKGGATWCPWRQMPATVAYDPDEHQFMRALYDIAPTE